MKRALALLVYMAFWRKPRPDPTIAALVDLRDEIASMNHVQIATLDAVSRPGVLAAIGQAITDAEAGR